MSDTPSVVLRARWKLAHALWPDRLRPDKVLTNWRLRAAEAEALALWNAGGGDALGPRPEARSQNGEDALLWDLVGRKDRGFFVEAGAYDGYTFSVSYLFECVGWRGVLVEPLPDRAAECEVRRRSRVVQAALSHPGAAPTATFARDVQVEWNSRLAEPGGGGGDTVPVTTLETVLAGHAGPIDFVVLDLEGQELAALAGLDLERRRPRALLIENESASAKLRDELEPRGYGYVASLANNDLFLHSTELALRERLGRYWSDVVPA
jgi:FkbM family methyltransferase